MSSRQKTSKKPKPAKGGQTQARQTPSSTLLRNVIRAAAILTIAGIASPVSQLNLSPVFGSIPASLHHKRTLTLTAIAALMSRRGLRGYVSANIAKYVAVVAFWTPVIQALLFPHSAKLGTEYGPLLIESLTYSPLLFLSMYAAMGLLESLDLGQFNLPPSVGEVIMPMASYLTVSSVAKLSGERLPGLIGTSIIFTRVGLQLLLSSLSIIFSPSKVAVLALPAILHTLWINPHLATEHGLQLANSTLQSSQNFSILARHESITGYVSVLENSADSAYRLLRCDHSLLGGEWLVTPTAYERGQRLPETVFTVFVLLEAVRLIEVPKASGQTTSESDGRESGLVIGLGIGTAPNAFIAHGINTTIVELDPIVHHYATKYFGLSSDHTAVLDDAITYVAEKSVTDPASFKYIIHDVFTGGAEPVYLFTTEFLRGLFDLLTDDGAVAINYAGDLALGSTQLVLNTIHDVFPACRLFRDMEESKDRKEGEPDFINMVVFCIKNDQGRGKQAVQFRKAGREDFLGSYARGNYLQPKDALEIKYSYVSPEKGGRVMGRAQVGELEKHHRVGAVGHWGLMRNVLPPGLWEMW